jgi:uncharacterized protein YeaO (DUF488 family)
MKVLRAKLNHSITRFRKLQSTYTPEAIQALPKRVTTANDLPEDVPLMLPSSLSEEEHGNRVCVSGVLKIEDSL